MLSFPFESIRHTYPVLHRLRRLTFAKKYSSWTIEDWSRVIFSEECQIRIFGNERREWFWKKRNEPLQERHIQPTIKHSGGSIMMWGYTTSYGIGRAYRIIENLNAEIYSRILDQEMIATLQLYNLSKQEIVFQHDNDPKHKAKLIDRLFENNQIQVLHWPSQSPDLNPIENLWAEIKGHLRSRFPKITSQDDLWEKVNIVWESLTQEDCLKLIRTMTERIQADIKAKGGYTRW
ncbi:uncharacterized protein VTP21DRAFT_5932 [Calcarisporiella thermophila]|uniref:uncharacterized protein n=1 Tax=Calcarisporiella thermophila TaxID=911321 RepID=UPI00374264BC